MEREFQLDKGIGLSGGPVWVKSPLIEKNIGILEGNNTTVSFKIPPVPADLLSLLVLMT